MKEKIVIFCADDMHPEKGFGLTEDEPAITYIKKLNKTFGLKSTLFVPINWHGKYLLDKYPEWVDFLKKLQNHGHEIASHGLYHYTENKNAGVREFLLLSEDQTNMVLKDIKTYWMKLGVFVSGIRYPGWGETKATEKYSSEYFDYIATHMIGEKPIRGFQGIYKMPYNLTIDNLYDVGQDVFILHAHIGNDKRNDNLLTYDTYLNVAEFLKELESKYKVKYMTYKEYYRYITEKEK